MAPLPWHFPVRCSFTFKVTRNVVPRHPQHSNGFEESTSNPKILVSDISSVPEGDAEFLRADSSIFHQKDSHCLFPGDIQAQTLGKPSIETGF